MFKTRLPALETLHL